MQYISPLNNLQVKSAPLMLISTNWQRYSTDGKLPTHSIIPL